MSPPAARHEGAPARPIDNLPVCLIGAGSSGLTTAKALLARGIRFDCFEIGSKLGGMWRYENDNGLSSAYRSLHIDTSRKSLGYSDFPIPSRCADFLSHFEIIDYLESYAAHFGILPHIRFNTRVENVERNAADGSWHVTLQTGETRRYRAVLVANGHLSHPRWPDFPGRFDGDIVHSHHYRTSTPYADKNVLVVGIGNSAVDIAVDIAKQAKKTLMSTRRSAWIMPKYIMGIPADRWSGFFARKLKFPTPVTRSLMRYLMWLAVGDQARYGVPRPAHAIWREHATVSQELLPYIGHGWIRIKPDVKELSASSVTFTDGSKEAIDAIIYATGYQTSFPFIDKALFEVADGRAALYRRMVAPHAPGLYMMGLVQPVGPTIPLVEIQGRWIADVLCGKIRLPSAASMDDEIARHHRHLGRRYVGSARYTLEVDFRAYAKQLAADTRRGRAGV